MKNFRQIFRQFPGNLKNFQIKNPAHRNPFPFGYPDGNLKTRPPFIPVCWNTLKKKGIVQARYFAGSFPDINVPFAIIRHF